MAESLASSLIASEDTLLSWLALSLTSGLGPARSRHLVEHFGSATAVLHASLTELEATGMMASSTQALGTGKSLELAHEELIRAQEHKCSHSMLPPIQPA